MIQRYRVYTPQTGNALFIPDPEGEWVRYSDHVAAQLCEGSAKEFTRLADVARDKLKDKRAGGGYRNGYDIGYLLGTAHAYEHAVNEITTDHVAAQGGCEGCRYSEGLRHNPLSSTCSMCIRNPANQFDQYAP